MTIKHLEKKIKALEEMILLQDTQYKELRKDYLDLAYSVKESNKSNYFKEVEILKHRTRRSKRRKISRRGLKLVYAPSPMFDFPYALKSKVIQNIMNRN